MKPVFCGNFEYETRQSDLERAFSRYGRVDRVDMKSARRCLLDEKMEKSEMKRWRIAYPSKVGKEEVEEDRGVGVPVWVGFAFVYFEDERDADDAIRGLDNKPFGYSRRKLSVEWARQGERGSRHREGSKSMANQRPTKTLFVINFDPIHTRIRDIERHFDSYGKILHVRIRRNFAFVQFETQEEATKALECTHMTKILDRVVSVEYALRDDGERDRRDGGPRRGHGERSVSPYGRSRSPLYRKSRPSPDYGRGRSRPSPDYGRGRSRPSPDYGRARSPGYARSRSPGYGRPPSRDYGRAPSRDYGRAPSPDYSHSRSPGYGPARSPARSPGYERARSPGYDRARSPDYDRAQSPSNGHAQSPGNGRVGSPDYVHSQSPVYADNDKHSPDFDKDRSRSPVRRSRS